jgi:Na+/melibiose symporter-like transporter
MNIPAPRKLSFGRIALYSMASAGLNILAVTIDTWLLYFYAPPPDSGRPQYLPLALIGVLLMFASIWDAAIDPFIGHWSTPSAHAGAAAGLSWYSPRPSSCSGWS